MVPEVRHPPRPTSTLCEAFSTHRTVADHEVVEISLRVVLRGHECGDVELHLGGNSEEGPEPEVETFHMRQATEHVLFWVHCICFYRRHGVRHSELCHLYLALGVTVCLQISMFPVHLSSLTLSKSFNFLGLSFLIRKMSSWKQPALRSPWWYSETSLAPLISWTRILDLAFLPFHLWKTEGLGEDARVPLGLGCVSPETVPSLSCNEEKMLERSIREVRFQKAK